MNNPNRAAVMTTSGEVLETDMGDIELGIVLDYLARNQCFARCQPPAP